MVLESCQYFVTTETPCDPENYPNTQKRTTLLMVLEFPQASPEPYKALPPWL